MFRGPIFGNHSRAMKMDTQTLRFSPGGIWLGWRENAGKSKYLYFWVFFWVEVSICGWEMGFELTSCWKSELDCREVDWRNWRILVFNTTWLPNQSLNKRSFIDLWWNMPFRYVYSAHKWQLIQPCSNVLSTLPWHIRSMWHCLVLLTSGWPKPLEKSGSTFHFFSSLLLSALFVSTLTPNLKSFTCFTCNIIKVAPMCPTLF